MSYGSDVYRSDRPRGRSSSNRRDDAYGNLEGSYGERRSQTTSGWGHYGDDAYGARNASRQDDDAYGSRSYGSYGGSRSEGRRGVSGWNSSGATIDDAYGAECRGSRDDGYGSGYGRGGGYGSTGNGLRGDGFRGGRKTGTYEVAEIKLKPEDYTFLEEYDRMFYFPKPIVNIRSREEVAAIRRNMDMTIDPSDGPAPVTSFEEAFESNQRYILETIRGSGFDRPTPIQCQSWPIILSGHNMIGIAETGSGKTLAFLLPAIAHMLGQPDLVPGDGPLALMLAPTRELSIQIHEECVKFGHPCGIKTVCVYGGAKKQPQMRELRQGVHLLVATPGRLIDFLESRDTNLRRVTYFVLDEADRMLDMGFEPQIMKIVDQIRPDRQTVLWSATWPREVEEIAAEIVQRPYKVTIGADQLRANHNITQQFQMMSGYERKIDKLVELLRDLPIDERILIFCGTKKSVDDITTHLRTKGLGALAIHGDKEQAEREWVLEEFRRGSSPIMVATDVAQRGLDVKDVYCVVNYDMPNTGEDYVHRIGRTGRAGRRGLSVSFFTPDDARIAKSIIRVLEEAGQQVSEDLHRFANNHLNEPSFRGRRSNGGFRRTGANAVPVHQGWGR